MWNNKPPKKNIYFHLWIAAAKDQVFFNSSLDKAFFITLLQDSLSPRLMSWAKRIDLVAYSLTDYGVNLLARSTNKVAIEEFGQQLLMDYSEFLSGQKDWEVLPFDTVFAHDRLKDEHEALSISREIHLLHDDWRYDRYSSIGFFLDDRRGDWIQPWPLTDLFENDSQWYLDFLQADEQYEPGILTFIET